MTHTDERNLILESEHLTTTIDVARREPQYQVRVVVSTRYCVLPIEETGPLSRDREDGLRGWLERRADLFRRYTLPSMVSQQHHPIWVLLVDERLMHLVAPTVQADLPDWAHLVAVPAGRSAGSYLDEVIKPDRRWTVAARVDNDDAVAVDYCKGFAIWAGLSGPHEALLSYPFGSQVTDGIPTVRFTPSVTGHFSGLVIPPGGRINTSLAYMHPEVYRSKAGLDVPVRQLITTQPMWCEVVHGENVANHVQPGPTLNLSGAAWSRRFG